MYNDSLAYAFLNEVVDFPPEIVVSSAVSTFFIHEAIDYINEEPEVDIEGFNYEQFLGLAKIMLLVDSAEMDQIDQEIQLAEGKLWNHSKLGSITQHNKYRKWSRRPKWLGFRGKRYWKKFHKAGFGCHLSMSLPVFNRERNIGVIYIGVMCDDLLGHGDFHRYELIDGQWTLTRTHNIWIS
ncbi:hypothetical protein [Sanyastnella coralliicola]|uniref:hypothetical protein n=1 Tax=Sanyastnella coralliicola TaxID=3069118 RepID=UPI0027BA642B|nr:hypothetical protein [Longitalea sp. SCSIO 12813]